MAPHVYLTVVSKSYQRKGKNGIKYMKNVKKMLK